MSFEDEIRELDAQVRAKDIIRFFETIKNYEHAAKALGLPSEFDSLSEFNRMKRIKKLYRECYGLKTPLYYEEDIELFFDVALKSMGDC